MAVNLATGNLLQFRMWSSDGEQAAVNTVYYRVGTVTGFVSDLDAAIAFDNAMHTVMKAVMFNGVTYRGTQARVFNAIPLTVAQEWTANAGPGTAGAVGMSRQTCGLISFYTNLAGPGNRGRMFLPFPATADDAGLGVPTGGYVAKLNAISIALGTFTVVPGTGTDTAAVGIVLKKGGVVSPIPIISTVERDKWATQRRRGSYGRANSSPI